MSQPEIPPPWAKHPDFGPGDFYWREAGQPWFVYVWQPYWKSLPPEQQAEYLRRWNVPEVWRKFYFDQAFQKWLESTDETD